LRPRVRFGNDSASAPPINPSWRRESESEVTSSSVNIYDEVIRETVASS
jgi:hypothetical protein